MKRLLTILISLLATLSAGAVIRTEVHGQVFLDDDVVKPGDYVMVYAQEFGTGTLTDEEGNYSLSLPCAAPKTVKLEFSRIGYAAFNCTITLPNATNLLAPVHMEPQPLMLTAAYVIPAGKTPGEYVLSKVWERAKQNRKNEFNYKAEVSYNLSTHELPVVANALPKAAVGLAKTYGAFQGYGPLVRYCLKNDDFSAKVTLNRQVKDGQTLDYNKKLVSSDKPLPDNVKSNVLNLMAIIDFYECMYGESCTWGAKFAKKHKFTLTGTYEYNDHLVDVLKCTDHKNKVTATVHVVEDLWMIMKVQLTTKEGEVLRVEARDVGNGIYMPISLVIKPSVSMIRADEIPELIETVKTTKDLTKGSRERIIKVLESHLGEDFNPYISVAGNVRYSL